MGNCNEKENVFAGVPGGMESLCNKQKAKVYWRQGIDHERKVYENYESKHLEKSTKLIDEAWSNYDKAVRADPDFAKAWMSLGQLPLTGQERDGQGERLPSQVRADPTRNATSSTRSRVYCYEMAVVAAQKDWEGMKLAHDALTLSDAWFLLGSVGGSKDITEAGRKRGKTDTESKNATPQLCFIRCLELNADNHSAWNNLGVMGGGRVGSYWFRETECFQKAIELQSDNLHAWVNLGTFGGGTVNGKRYTERSCYQKAIACADFHMYAEVSGRTNKTDDLVDILWPDNGDDKFKNQCDPKDKDKGFKHFTEIMNSNNDIGKKVKKVNRDFKGEMEYRDPTKREDVDDINFETGLRVELADISLKDLEGMGCDRVLKDEKRVMPHLSKQKACRRAYLNLGTAGGTRGLRPRSCFANSLLLDRSYSRGWQSLGLDMVRAKKQGEDIRNDKLWYDDGGKAEYLNRFSAAPVGEKNVYMVLRDKYEDDNDEEKIEEERWVGPLAQASNAYRIEDTIKACMENAVIIAKDDVVATGDDKEDVLDEGDSDEGRMEATDKDMKLAWCQSAIDCLDRNAFMFRKSESEFMGGLLADDEDDVRTTLKSQKGKDNREINKCDEEVMIDLEKHAGKHNRDSRTLNCMGAENRRQATEHLLHLRTPERSLEVLQEMGAPADFDKEEKLCMVGEYLEKAVQNFKMALQKQLNNSTAWCNMGEVLETIAELREEHDCKEFVPIDCLSYQQETISAGPPRTSLYGSLGSSLREIPGSTEQTKNVLTVSITTKHKKTGKKIEHKYSAMGCYKKALENNPKNCTAWNNMAVSLQGDDTVTIHDTTYNATDCYQRALQLDGDQMSPQQQTHTWYNLGLTLRRCEDSTEPRKLLKAQQKRRQEQFHHYRLARPASPPAGGAKGEPVHSETVAVNGQQYTTKECFLQALRLNRRHWKAWGMLSMLGGGTVDGHFYSWQECQDQYKFGADRQVYEDFLAMAEKFKAEEQEKKAEKTKKAKKKAKAEAEQAKAAGKQPEKDLVKEDEEKRKEDEKNMKAEMILLTLRPWFELSRLGGCWFNDWHYSAADCQEQITKNVRTLESEFGENEDWKGKTSWVEEDLEKIQEWLEELVDDE